MVNVEQTKSGVKITNSQGKVYWLHSSAPNFYFLRKSRGRNVVKTLPEDREFSEESNGFVYIRKR